MFKLHVVQADYGDCLILEYGSPDAPRCILVDGGPPTVYEQHLRQVLLERRQQGAKLDAVVLTHIDDDHIVGLLDLMADIHHQRTSGLPETIAIDQLWHNTFSQTVGPEIEARCAALLHQIGTVPGLPTLPSKATRSINHGDELTHHADALQIAINAAFAPQQHITLEQSQHPIRFGTLTLRILGPDQKSLSKLRKQWIKWLQEHEKQAILGMHAPTPRAPAKIDESVPNLSSILFLAEVDGKTILLTGDGTSDQVLRGLQYNHLLDPTGKLHVNVLKLPHHANRRNVTKGFFSTITADQYVVCANGRDDNPDLTTLTWLVDAARADKRPIEIFATKESASIRQLRLERPPDQYGYQFHIMPAGSHMTTIELDA